MGGASVVSASHPELGDRFLYCEGDAPLLFTENETNNKRLFGTPNQTPYVKDGINNCVVQAKSAEVNPEGEGTKVSPHYRVTIPPGQCEVVRLRLNNIAPKDLKSAYAATKGNPFGAEFDAVVKTRREEADEFYATVIPAKLDADASNVMRQAVGGMLWSKQFYNFDVDKWLDEHGADPFKSKQRAPRNNHWHHMNNADIISMPDKWEYPWYAAWDLAFHILALSLVDEEFGKQQLDLMLEGRYLHPNGQLPAYEWNFGDVNPPVHAWSTIFTYRLEQVRRGNGDLDWLERSFQKLLLNFTWWVNRKDRTGKNAFEGGFLGLDNIGVFDRSAPLPTGGYLEQADGTAWMVLFCQNMLEIAVQLALERPAYAEMAAKFAQHFLWISSAMVHAGEDTGMWDEEDGFFYDVLRLPDGTSQRLKVRSMVGLLPLCAVTVLGGRTAGKVSGAGQRFQQVSGGAAGADGVHPRPSEDRLLRADDGVGFERNETTACADEDARREGVSEPIRNTIVVAVSRGTSLRVSLGEPGLQRVVSTSGVRYGDVRRQLELARADLDAGQRANHPGAADVPHVLRR